MITAIEANFRSKNQVMIDNIIEDLEKEVMKNIAKCQYSATVSISLETNQEIREYLYNYLMGLGYKVEITDHEKDNEKMGGHSVDQGYYYDNITIRW